MDKELLKQVSVDEQSIERFATKQASEIVEIDMTTPEYTADTCEFADDNIKPMNIRENI